MPYDRSLYEADLLVANAAGYDLMDWQIDGLRDWCAVDGDGKWIHRRCCDAIPRQAGKSVRAIVHATTAAVAYGATVLWTDHNYSTTCEMLERFRDIFGARPHDRTRGRKAFNDMVLRTVSKTAQEAIFLKNGGSIHFSTRTKGTALGFSFDMVVFDEAQELTDAHVQAVMPTTTSGRLKNLQLVYSGTPTRAGSPATVWTNARGQAWEGGPDSDGMCWWEWGVDEIGDVRDESRWRLVNPSIDAGLADIEAIRTASKSMTELAFAQEYLGYWLPATKADALIARGKWDACASGEPGGEPLAYGVKLSRDGQTASVAVCAEGPGGLPRVELVDSMSTAHGKGRLVAMVADRAARCPVAVDGKSGSRTLTERVEAAEPGAMTHVVSTQEAVSACSGFIDAVRERGMTWYRPPGMEEDDRLTASAVTVSKRPIGGDGGFGFDGPDPTPAEAAALALWAARNLEPMGDMEVYY